jgi:hypothetical protein
MAIKIPDDFEGYLYIADEIKDTLDKLANLEDKEGNGIHPDNLNGLIVEMLWSANLLLQINLMGEYIYRPKNPEFQKFYESFKKSYVYEQIESVLKDRNKI